ncbi:hypothetical protein [Actinomadura sp. NTSP31]|uniref:hypothetical protein n=1 Tax=Actinomadura sp. NTSP31 TaxID=1735447 RepID=UPI0035C0A2B4
MKFKKTKIAAASVAAGVLALSVATPALAYDQKVSTDDGDPGGRVEWTAYGDVVKVCDIEADGWAAKVFVGYFVSGFPPVHDSYSLQAGGNGTCKTARASDGGSHDLPEGKQLSITVCLADSSHPQGTYCDWIEPYNNN